MLILARLARLAAFAIALFLASAGAPRAEPQHAIAMLGMPALPPGFTHFPYADPEAPKGGRLVLAALGSFDSLNPFIVRGNAPSAIRNLVFESLMVRSYDEPFTLYGLIAETIELAPDHGSVTFRIHPRARFSDGRPITPNDVIFSWQLLRDKGRPNHRTFYRKVLAAEVVDGNGVRFDLADRDDRELPLILGLMPVLPAHLVDIGTFEETTFQPPVGSGPYLVAEVKPGESILLKKNPDWWGRDLPVNRGLHNFDEQRFDYYRDTNTMFEAFKKGLYDLRVEDDPARWRTAYDFPAMQDGRLKREAFSYELPKPISAFVFNTRRPIFADVRVREALGCLFDFEWINANLFFSAYRRTTSFFEGSELAATGRPAGPAERALLARFPGAVRADILDGKWAPPRTDASGRDRAPIRKALALLAAAGWTIRDGTLVNAKGEPFAFETMVLTKEQERLALVYGRSLERAGIRMSVRIVDAAQFERRRNAFEFDMMPFTWLNSLSPGNEQAFYWGSAAADQPGSRNYMGVKSPALDAAIAALVAARTREELVAAARTIDRILQSGFYVLPLYHLPEQWVVRKTDLAHPPNGSLYGYVLESWWWSPRSN